MNPVVLNDMREIKLSMQDHIWSRLIGKTVLISGANGMLPSYCVDFLMYMNNYYELAPIKVIALCRNEKKAKQRFYEYLKNDCFNLIIQDVCDPIDYTGEVDYIIHAAAQASPKYYSIDPVGTILPNTLGTYNLLEFAKRKKITSFLFFSSNEIYGDTSILKSPIAEDTIGSVDPIKIRSCYAESKRLGETMCIAYAHQFQVPAVIVRLGHTYGPPMSLDDGRIFADFVSDIVKNRNIALYSDGFAERFFCYITDAVAGVFLILLRGQTGDAYNLLNTDCRIKIRDLAQMLVTLFTEKNIKVVFECRKDGHKYIPSPLDIPNDFDTSKLQNLGWRPKIGIKEGFKRTINFFTSC